jgi:hypothetical protein
MAKNPLLHPDCSPAEQRYIEARLQGLGPSESWRKAHPNSKAQPASVASEAYKWERRPHVAAISPKLAAALSSLPVRRSRSGLAAVSRANKSQWTSNKPRPPLASGKVKAKHSAISLLKTPKSSPHSRWATPEKPSSVSVHGSAQKPPGASLSIGFEDLASVGLKDVTPKVPTLEGGAPPTLDP